MRRLFTTILIVVVSSSLLDGSTESPETATNAPELASVPGTTDAWWASVHADLARREYEASTTPHGLQAPNRAHNLRTTFRERGIEVMPRTGQDGAPAWRFAWETSGIGRAGRMEDVAPASPEPEGARVTYRRGGWSEWYVNTAQGLEQGFTIERRPAGEGPLRIVGGFPAALRAEPREDGAIDFIDGHGARVIRYGELRAWDARGVALASELIVAGTDLAIVVDDRAATYPLTVDPLMTSAAWTAESDQASANFGWSVRTAGDVNGDGFSDVIVGAKMFDNGETNEGRAFVYHGSAGGLGVTANWTAEGNQAEAYFGHAVATAGDVNGDGFGDVIVGAYGYDNGESGEGRAFVYHGSASGLSPTPSWTAESDQDGAQFGWSVGTAGDVNGDGFSDVIVGADLYDNGLGDEGRAYVYHGSAAGLSTPAWTAALGQVSAHFGFAVGTAGDVNADGFSDVIVGAFGYDNGQTDEGGAFVFHGSSTGLVTTIAWTAESGQANAFFGWSVGTAGDFNGDGFSDVIVGAIAYDNPETSEGLISVYFGSATGLSTSGSWSAQSNQAGCELGGSVGTAGDVNGDGFADVIAGAYAYDNGETNEGRAFVYFGTAAGSPSTVWTAESNQGGAQFGISVAAAGDVNGDGFSDVIVGAFAYDNGQSDEGRAFVYHGSAAGLAPVPAWTAEGDQVEARFGNSVASAGDVNGDGYGDVIVGAHGYDTGQIDAGRAFVYHGSATGLATSPAWSVVSAQAGAQFGWSVGSAGDVNGDGFSDVIIGAVTVDNGESNEGQAFVYQGSAAGLDASPAWSAEGDQAGAGFGGSVATAGDVNGDGYSDVIVSADGYDNGEQNEGRAFVYHGSAAGLATSPAWTAESDQVSAFFGSSVATAGDVNGDGYSDVVVGAEFYDNGQDNEGRAFVYHGSATGLATLPAWTAESDQVGARFGNAVATAGDVNGDGYSDVAVGAYLWDNPHSDEGRAYVYHGSASGLSVLNWFAEGNQLEAEFGGSVATAGDVNGDGYSDLIVGARRYDNGEEDEGQAFVYHGSAIGLSSVPSRTLESNLADANFGQSVAMAGDVNGDGYSDVLVGADTYSNGQSNEGRTFLYYGNEGDGLDRTARQARSDDSAPIALLGASASESSFLLKVLGRTPAGRGQVRFQFEVKPFGVPFDGSGLVTGATFDTGTPVPGSGSAVALSQLASGLTAETLYHWRLRTITGSPFFPRSPWFTPAGNALTEADVRTGETTTGVETAVAPSGPRMLESARPNPFTPSTEISYTLPEAGRVRLAAYDAAGRQVAVLADGAQAAGRHTARWNGHDAAGNALPAGVYLVRLEAGGWMTSRKLVIAR